jgi:guanylate kinase
VVGKLFIISAPSGAGKTTLVHGVLGRIQSEYSIQRVITYTTKSARPGEQDGKDYHFISSQEFTRRIKEGFFLEWSDAYGSYYGSPRSIIDEVRRGKSYVMILDRVGAEQVLKVTSNLVLIWIHTKDLQVLRQRLAGRGTETVFDFEYRIAQAEKELKLEQEKSLYHYRILNDNFDAATKKLEEIFIKELKSI